jgi:hypothetical protein
VSRYLWGAIYLVPQGWDPDAEDADERIAYSFEYGRSHIEMGAELWKLVDPARARQIDDIVLSAYGRRPRILNQDDIAALLRLLDGLEQRLAGTYIDEHWNTPLERIPELRERTKMLEISEKFPETAVGAGIYRVTLAREILETARDEKLDILFD